MFNWILGQLRKGCRKIVYSWKSSEFESTESCEKAPRPQPNSVFAQFSVVCMFNWMLGQLRRVVGRSYVRGKAPNLNRLSSEGKSIKSHPRLNSVFAQFSIVCMFNWMLGQLRKAVWRSSVRGKALNLNRLSSTRKNQKSRPQPNSVTRAIPSHVYVQLDARPVKEGCRKVVCSWKGSEFESAEQCEEISQKPRPQPHSVIRAIPSHVYVQLDARPVKEGCRKVVCSWKGSEFESA